MRKTLPESEKICELLETSSRYFAILLRRFPEYSSWLAQKVSHRFTAVELYRSLSEELKHVSVENLWEHLARTFRSFKQKHFLRLGARNLLELDSFQDTVSQLSDLAIALLQMALQKLLDNPSSWLPPADLVIWEREKPNISLVVLGLGKLGGKELNFVSDIDLIFLYHANSPKSASVAQALLPRIAQTVSRLFSDIIDGDRVFMVDLRLRPGGKDGELVPSLGYAVHYYLLQGRSWERLALIKATPVAGDISIGNQFLAEVQPFVFRRFLDFQAIDEMKSLRDQMLKETPLEEPGPGYNVKLGKGGIREIEFLIQSLQLTYGGRLRHLREKNTLRCIDLLKDEKLISKTDAESFSRAYIFLRNLEHWVQLQENRQTQLVPKDTTLQYMLAKTLGFPGPDELFQQLRNHTQIVRYHFERLFGVFCDDNEPAIYSGTAIYPALTWLEEILEKDLAAEVSNILERDETFRTLYPHLEARLKQWAQAVAKRPGLCKFLTSLKARENQVLDKAIFTLIHIPLLGKLVIQVPSLIESFTDESEFIKDYSVWKQHADEILDDCGNFEEAILWLRRLKNERLLHIALWDVKFNPSIADLEREITLLADFFVQATYRLVCSRILNCSPKDYPLLVAAMGKWGSFEMGYKSDLDLVFIHFPEKENEGSQIPDHITRLIQRFVRLLSMALQEGPGYDVDMRLRPTGNYGPLVVTYPSWVEYYSEKADIWEIASLLKFRPVVGCLEVAGEIHERVKDFCFRDRSVETVLKRLCELKSRIEEERTRETEKGINLKLGKGGLIELEFWCQATALSCKSYEWKHPLVTMDALSTVFEFWKVPKEERKDLLRAFTVIRRLQHRFDLLGKNVEEFIPDDLNTLKDLKLWGNDDHSRKYQDWSDIQRFRRAIRYRWDQLCSKKKE